MSEKPLYTIALAGNPNVGKSTIFNLLTGGRQHTGNWTGKTVATAKGFFETKTNRFELVDLPGTYSLVAHSAEEAVARDYIAYGEHDGVVVVCDAGCLERNLNLVLQITEITDRVLVCVNLLDEAEKRGIHVDLKKLSEMLGVPVIGTVAKNKKSAAKFMEALDNFVCGKTYRPFSTIYPADVEIALSELETELCVGRWLGLKYLLGELEPSGEEKHKVVEQKRKKLVLSGENLQDVVVKTIFSAAKRISKRAVSRAEEGQYKKDRRLDRVLTGKFTAYPVMLALLAFIFLLTIVGANYPSEFLAKVLFYIQDKLTLLFEMLHAPQWLHGALVLGVYRVAAWVVSVMLPPMAIFFPLFTLLEDVGYLPRIAYNLDKPLQKCKACGKQALTMWSGFTLFKMT